MCFSESSCLSCWTQQHLFFYFSDGIWNSRKGADVRGYHVWSFMDLYELFGGYHELLSISILKSEEGSQGILLTGTQTSWRTMLWLNWNVILRLKSLMLKFDHWCPQNSLLKNSSSGPSVCAATSERSLLSSDFVILYILYTLVRLLPPKKQELK